VLILTVFMLYVMFGRRFAAISQARGRTWTACQRHPRYQRYLAIKTGIGLVTGLLSGLLCWAARPFLRPLGHPRVCPELPRHRIAGRRVPPCSSFPRHGYALLVAVYLLINNFLGSIVDHCSSAAAPAFFTGGLSSPSSSGVGCGPLGMLLAVPLTMVIKVGILDGGENSVGSPSPSPPAQGSTTPSPNCWKSLLPNRTP
jgi:hypothetical protein